MGPALPILGAIAPLLSGVTQLMGAFGAKDAGDENAAATRAEAAESARREKTQQEEVEARGRASAAASGVLAQGTPSAFLEDQKAKHAREIDWLKTSGESRAKADERQGQQGFLSGLAGAAGSVGKAGKAGKDVAGLFK